MTIDGPIMTLDLATNSGFCVGWADDPNPKFGHMTIPPTGDDIGRFGNTFLEWFDEMVNQHQPGLICFCAPILPKKTSPITVRKLTLLPGLVEMRCRKPFSITCREAYEASVKKHFVGSGKAKKVDTIGVCRRYGWRVRTDDEADACALWVYSVSLYAPQDAGRFALGPMGAREVF